MHKRRTRFEISFLDPAFGSGEPKTTGIAVAAPKQMEWGKKVVYVS